MTTWTIEARGIDPELFKIYTGGTLNLTYADVEKRMSHHPPSDAETIEAHGLLRDLAKAHAKAVMDLLPAGREKSLVMTALEEALMWANAAVARNGGPAPHIQITEIEVIRSDFNIHYGTAPREGGVTLGGRDAGLTLDPKDGR